MLILPIKKKWFDMIRSGEKKEEYREIKSYWTTRLGNYFINHIIDSNTKKVLRKMNTAEKEVIFRNGYSPVSPMLKCTCKLRIGQGKEEWGAEKRERVLHIRDFRCIGGVSMPRKKKYENAEIVKGILSREANAMGDMQLCISIKFIDFKSEADRKFLANNIKGVRDMFNDALRELEG